MSEKITAQVGDKQIIIETGKLAKQADGAVTVQLGDTIVIVAAVAATKAKEGQEFFPADRGLPRKSGGGGQIPRRLLQTRRPSDGKGNPHLRGLPTAPSGPSFPKGWYNEVQVQSILLSADGENDPDILSIIGASTALMVSDIPWAGPLGAVRVGRVNGKFVANPTHSEMKESDLDLVYVGNETDIVMYEGSAKEISEADFNAALKFGHEAIQPIIAAQKELVASGRPEETRNHAQRRARRNFAGGQNARRRPLCARAAHAGQTRPRSRRQGASRMKSARNSSRNSARKKSPNSSSRTRFITFKRKPSAG